MKNLLFIFILFILRIVVYDDKKIELRILDSKIEDGKFVDIEFKNNTKFDYCFVIDTFYYRRDKFSNDGNFHNPIVFLNDRNGKEVSILQDINGHGSINDSVFQKNIVSITKERRDTLLIDEKKIFGKLYHKGFVSTLNIYKIKSKKTLRLKIPFHLVTKYLRANEHEYYDIDRKKKYQGSIKYMINREFIQRYIAKGKIDSLERKGYKFFVGSLKSNAVPLIIEK